MPKSTPSPMNRTAKATEIRLSAPTIAKPIAAVMDRPTNRLMATAKMMPKDRKASHRIVNTTTMVTAVLTNAPSSKVAYSSSAIATGPVRRTLAPYFVPISNSTAASRMRSEERRVGKEWRSGWSTDQTKQKDDQDGS